MRRPFAIAVMCALYIGALAGHISFDLFERSYYRRSRIYLAWMERTRNHTRSS